MMRVPGCMSCDILAGKLTTPGGVIYEDEYWQVDSVISPVYWRGFLIIKLKRHCEHLAELTPEEAGALGPVVRATCSALAEVLKPAKVYVCSFGDGVKHIHLWVRDCGHGEIAQGMQLIAGRTGQEYNQRKGRKGAIWEDPYHGTAVEI